jgi:hypothetical protein
MLECHRYNPLEIGVVEWLVDIGDCVKLKGFAGALGIGIPGHHNDRDSGIDRADSLEHFKTAQVGQRNIEQDQIWMERGNELQTLLARHSATDHVVVFAKTHDQEADHCAVVVNYEDSRGWQLHRRHDRLLTCSRAPYQLQFLELSSAMRISSFAMTHRNHERESRAYAYLALYPDLAAMELHELPAQGEP